MPERRHHIVSCTKWTETIVIIVVVANVLVTGLAAGGQSGV